MFDNIAQRHESSKYVEFDKRLNEIKIEINQREITRKKNLCNELSALKSRVKNLSQKTADVDKTVFEEINYLLNKETDLDKIENGIQRLYDKINLEEKNSIESKNYFPNGFERAVFKASLNKNNFDEITKIASGGELSRFMLALKVALIDVKSVPTIIFDEIDTGVSGSTSDAIGKRLRTLAKASQILVVTHQPQIASKADSHLKISKSEIGGKVKTKIEILDKDSKIDEIARMLSGEEISPEAMSASRKLLEEK